MDGKPLEVHNTPFTPLRGRGSAGRGTSRERRLVQRKLGLHHPRPWGFSADRRHRTGQASESRRCLVLSFVKLQRLARCTGSTRGVYRRDYLHLPPLRRGRRAGLPRRRRARRALAMAWWARGGAAWHARPPRRAIPADSTTSPNSPATPREHSFGCSRPTRRPCAILVGPAPCPSRRAPPPATRLARGFASWSYDVEFRFF